MDFEAQQDDEEEEEEQQGEDQHPHSPPSAAASPPPAKTRYRECLKNHALSVGGQAVDGCGEFLAAGPGGTVDHFRCAACGCHRNFHRREIAFPFHHHRHHHHRPAPPPPHLLLTHHPHGPPGYLHAVPPAQQQQRPMALASSSGEMEDYYSTPGGSGKKRFRTKFSQEQKEKMQELAERLEWRIQKQDEDLVHHFCSQMGINRHVLKVWMHNNKHTLGTRNKT